MPDRPRSIEVVLTAPFLRLFPAAQSPLYCEARDVWALLGHLDLRWPGMKDRISDSRPAIRRHILIFVNGARAKLDTPLRPGDKVHIVTAISGG